MFNFKKSSLRTFFLLSLCFTFLFSNNIFAAENNYFSEEELIQRITDINNKYLSSDEWEITDIDSSQIDKYSRNEVEQQLKEYENALKSDLKASKSKEVFVINIDKDELIPSENLSRVDITTGSTPITTTAVIGQTMSDYTIRVKCNVQWIKGYFYNISGVSNVSSSLYGSYLGQATWKQTGSGLENYDQLRVSGTLTSSNTIAGITLSKISDRDLYFTININ